MGDGLHCFSLSRCQRVSNLNTVLILMDNMEPLKEAASSVCDTPTLTRQTL